MASHKIAVLVEGPEWGDAKFYGELLLAAAKAESLWKEGLGDQDFEKKVASRTRVMGMHFPRALHLANHSFG